MSHSHDNDADKVLSEKLPGAFPVKTALLILAASLAVAGIAFVPHLKKEREAVEFAERTGVPTVAVINAASGDSVQELILPSSVSAFSDATVYARTTGYLKSRKVDIGSRVKGGDTLAEIDAPEVDAQLAQAAATLEQAKANVSLAELTAKRIETLRDTNAVSKQELDDKHGDVLTKIAARAAAEAEVVRLTQLVSFRNIVAPFEGIITERNTDVGDLITAGSTSPRPLFHISNLDMLRVFVHVPESYAGDIRIGDVATVAFTATPGVAPKGKIIRTAGAIDPTSRTMLVEIELPNPDGKLLPGGYAQVNMKVKSGNPAPVVPINVIFFRPEGTMVGVVGDDGLVAIKPVKLGRNYGTKVEITGGLTPADRIIVNPSDSLVSGTKVKILTPPPKNESAPK